MGYTKILQIADRTVVTQYQRNVPESKGYRASNRSKRNSTPYRSTRSIKRASRAFFDLVEHNLYLHEDLPNLLTLTYHDEYENYPELDVAYKHLQAFYTRVKKTVAPNLTYLSVPEWQKRGAVHFHCLVWGLGKSVREERVTRILQRLWGQGYCDVSSTYNKSSALSGYLTKYLSKAKSDIRLGNRKAYTASRNIERPREKGSNFLSDLLSTFIDDTDLSQTYTYDTKWLGRADVKVYKN